MSAPIQNDEAAAMFSDLAQTERTPGFALICEKTDEELARMVTQILDINTPDEKANELRRVRARMIELTPAAIMKTLKGKFGVQAAHGAQTLNTKET